MQNIVYTDILNSLQKFNQLYHTSCVIDGDMIDFYIENPILLGTKLYIHIDSVFYTQLCTYLEEQLFRYSNTISGFVSLKCKEWLVPISQSFCSIVVSKEEAYTNCIQGTEYFGVSIPRPDIYFIYNLDLMSKYSATSTQLIYLYDLVCNVYLVSKQLAQRAALTITLSSELEKLDCAYYLQDIIRCGINTDYLKETLTRFLLPFKDGNSVYTDGEWFPTDLTWYEN